MKNWFSTVKLFTIALLEVMVLVACNQSQAQEESPQQDVAGESAQTIHGATPDKVVLDSIRAIAMKADSLDRAQHDFDTRLSDVNNQLTETKRASSLYLLIAFCCAAIALIVAIMACSKTRNIKARLDRHRKDIDEQKLQLGNMQYSLGNGHSSTIRSTSTSDDYYKLASRLSSVELQLRSISQPNNRIEDQQSHVIGQPVIQTSNVYFGTPSQAQGDSAYFKKEFKHRDSEVMFSAVITGDNAEFRPIEGDTASLGTLKSSDTMKLAVQFEGCAPSEANSMQVILPGIAKFDGERWYIRKKTLVRLMK
jgi:hypothetical protein